MLDFSTFKGCRESLHWNIWDMKCLEEALRLTRGRKVAVQAGGNLGVFAARLAEEFDAVYTFEPDALLFPLLVENAPAENIIRFQAALGEKSSFIGTKRTTETQTHAGVTHVDGDGIIPTMRIDDLGLNACDLLYLDIEGYELFALKGAAQTIKRHRPVIVLEINDCCARYDYTKADLLALMAEWGYVQRNRVHNDHMFIPSEEQMILNLVAVRVGDKYGPEYVEILFDQLLRNLSTFEGEVRCWLITDEPHNPPVGIKGIKWKAGIPGWWQKVYLFSDEMPWSDGERVAYFDLDLCITGRLEDLIHTPGIIQDWKWPCYNSSVMVWDVGEHREIWQAFKPSEIGAKGNMVPQECLPRGEINGGDQEWITWVSKWNTFDPTWCVNYLQHAELWPSEGAKVVSFNGKLKPHEITEGWVPTVWKKGGLTSLPEMKGVNTSKAHILANVAANVQRDLPWFRPSAERLSDTMVLVCGGPSLNDSIPAIKDHRRRGARIVSVNNTLRFLQSHGITPDAHVMLDARPENVEFVKDASHSPVYFLASQCDPALFDALADYDVTLWHNAVDGGELETLALPYETIERPLTPVPGGGTVGLRCIWLAFFSGYRKLHIYGMDGSYTEGQHHAYPQSLNDGEEILNVVMAGKSYPCAKWMARQATEFQGTLREAMAHGMKIWVHGFGIIPDMARLLKAADKIAA